jgi:hypothetical protein
MDVLAEDDTVVVPDTQIVVRALSYRRAAIRPSALAKR